MGDQDGMYKGFTQNRCAYLFEFNIFNVVFGSIPNDDWLFYICLFNDIGWWFLISISFNKAWRMENEQQFLDLSVFGMLNIFVDAMLWRQNK